MCTMCTTFFPVTSLVVLLFIDLIFESKLKIGGTHGTQLFYNDFVCANCLFLVVHTRYTLAQIGTHFLQNAFRITFSQSVYHFQITKLVHKTTLQEQLS